MRVHPSQLDHEVTVIEVEDGDGGPLVDLLATRGLGFAMLGVVPKTVVIDRRILGRGRTQHHLLAIEAHEIAHHRVGTDEREADLEGIRILRAQNQRMAARLLQIRV
jgi:hypothetical protein